MGEVECLAMCTFFYYYHHNEPLFNKLLSEKKQELNLEFEAELNINGLFFYYNEPPFSLIKQAADRNRIMNGGYAKCHNN